MGRYLEVMEATEKEVRFFKRKTSEELKYANKSVPVDSESIICRLKGIPWETTHGDIERLLSDVPLSFMLIYIINKYNNVIVFVNLAAIHFPKDKSGRPNGMAFVEVADDELCVFLIIKDSLGKIF